MSTKKLTPTRHIEFLDKKDINVLVLLKIDSGIIWTDKVVKLPEHTYHINPMSLKID